MPRRPLNPNICLKCIRDFCSPNNKSLIPASDSFSQAIIYPLMAYRDRIFKFQVSAFILEVGPVGFHPFPRCAFLIQYKTEAFLFKGYFYIINFNTYHIVLFPFVILHVFSFICIVL